MSRVRARGWLAAYIACLCLLWIENVLEETRLILRWPHAAHLSDWLILLVGPCLWMYVRRLTSHETPRIRGLAASRIPSRRLSTRSCWVDGAIALQTST